jgi:hypothetical protein
MAYISGIVPGVWFRPDLSHLGQGATEAGGMGRPSVRHIGQGSDGGRVPC